VWREKGPKFWDGMWAVHEGSVMTEAIIEYARTLDSVIEIGCGCGHIVGQMIKRGFEGRYLGFDISKAAVARTREVIAPLEHASAIDGDFLTQVPLAQAFEQRHGVRPEAVIARGVLQHQAHWAPMVLAGLRCADHVVMGIGYTTIGPRHVGGWKRAGHYDVHISLPMLRYEAEAMGLYLTVTPMENPKRPKYHEALAVFAWPDTAEEVAPEEATA
jgi:hypothetical protein